MAGKVWVFADPHLGSANAAKYREFESVEEHDITIMRSMVDKLTSRDTLIIAGDVCWRHITHFDNLFEKVCKEKWGNILDVTIKVVDGNHDKPSRIAGSKYISSVQGMLEYNFRDSDEKIIITHIPIHPACMTRWKLNIHGHMHHDYILRDNEIPDPDYLCCSWEQFKEPVMIMSNYRSMTDCYHSLI